jgi:bacterioferritin
MRRTPATGMTKIEENTQEEPMNQKVIELLNQARAAELGAISQYMIHHYELEDKDFGKLAIRLKEIAIVEMKHAEKLAERILFLKGEPTSKPDILPKKGQSIPELLATDFSLEEKAVAMYNDAASICASEKDQKSKDLFEELVADEEGHLNIFENIKDHVDKMGAAYLATLTGKK